MSNNRFAVIGGKGEDGSPYGKVPNPGALELGELLYGYMDRKMMICRTATRMLARNRRGIHLTNGSMRSTIGQALRDDIFYQQLVAEVRMRTAWYEEQADKLPADGRTLAALMVAHIHDAVAQPNHQVDYNCIGLALHVGQRLAGYLEDQGLQRAFKFVSGGGDDD